MWWTTRREQPQLPWVRGSDSGGGKDWIYATEKLKA